MACEHGGSARRYGWLGAALGLGAPLGLVLLDRLLPSERRGRAGDRDRWLPLLYMTATTPVVFGAFGHAIGRSRDKIRAAQEEIDLLRDEFVAVVAHDLRDPVQAMLLQIQALHRDADGSMTMSAVMLERLRRGAGRLARMINDLLDASKIEVSHLTLMPESVSLPKFSRI